MAYDGKTQVTTPSDLPALDRFRFDQLAEGDRKLWGLPAIAQVMGCCIDRARRLANDPASGAPISKPGGRYFAVRSELLGWMRGKNV